MHNAEEAVTAERFLPHVRAEVLSRAPWLQQIMPDLTGFYIALAASTIISLVLILFSAVRSDPRSAPGPALIVAGAYLSNVFVPHVPAAIALRGYAPGIVSAVLLVLPVTAFFFRRSAGDRVIRRENLTWWIGAGFLLLVLFLPVAFLVIRLVR